MLLFVKTSNTFSSDIIIPVGRIYDIWAANCHININYDSGELIETELGYQKKLETITVVFNSADEVNKILRQFYKACNNKAGAFYFGTN